MSNSLRLVFVLWLAGPALAQPPDIAWTQIVGFPESYESVSEIIEAGDHSLVLVGGGGVGEFGWDGYWQRTSEYGDTIAARWLSRAGGEILYDGLLDIAGEGDEAGYLVAGTARPLSTGIENGLVVRLDLAGDTLWTREIGGPGNDACFDCCAARDGGSYVCGYTSSFGPDSINQWLVKLDSTGTVEWQRAYGSNTIDAALECMQTAEGDLLLAGITEPYGNQRRAFTLTKTDERGDSLWSRVYGRSDDYLIGAALTPTDGGCVLVGWSSGPAPYYNYSYVVKIDALGDTIWTRTYGHWGAADGARSVVVLPDGGYLVGGWTQPVEYEQPLDSLHDVCVWRLDAQGDSLWSIVIPDSSQITQCNSMVRAYDGGYVLACDQVFDGVVVLIKLEPELFAPEPAVPELGTTIKLLNNFPNPFNSSTTIRFELDRAADTRLTIHDILGRTVRTLVAERLQPGPHLIRFDAAELPSGQYIYTLQSGGARQSKKLVLVK